MKKLDDVIERPTLFMQEGVLTGYIPDITGFIPVLTGFIPA